MQEQLGGYLVQSLKLARYCDNGVFFFVGGETIGHK